MKRPLLALLLVLVLSLPAFAHDPNAVTTVILVRHAEKVTTTESKDPELTAAGQERSKELARVLAGAGVSAIFTTPFARTRNTAAPLAAALGLEPIEIAGGKTYADDLVKRLADYPGRTVLVVGHSNTTPDVMGRLGIEAPPSIADSQYDDLFIVTFRGTAAQLVSLRYGAVSR